MGTVNAVILGIDPGYHKLGFAVIKPALHNGFRLLDLGIITTTPRRPLLQRILFLLTDLQQVVREHGVTHAVIEEPQSLSIKRIRNVYLVTGAVVGELLKAEVQVELVTPTQLKRFVAGRGDAVKEQVKNFLSAQYSLDKKKLFFEDDAADALGLALMGLDLINAV